MDSGKRAQDDVNDKEMSSTADAPPLVLVQCALLRADARLVPLSHVATLFTQLLDVSPLVSLPKAAAMGSTRLVDRVLLRLTSDTSLDRAQLDFWFARALWAAIKRDDLTMIQHIHAQHLAPLFLHAASVPKILFTNALGLAFKYGTLETIQWLIAHRADRMCCSPGVDSACRGCVMDALRSIGDRDVFRIVMWLVENGFVSMRNARTVATHLWVPMQKSDALIRWLADRALVEPEATVMLFCSSVRQGYTATAMALLDVMDAPLPADVAKEYLLKASIRGMDDLVDKLITQGHCESFRGEFVIAPTTSGCSGLVQWDASSMDKKWSTRGGMTAAKVYSEDASHCGNLAVLQWLFHERDVQPELFQLAYHVSSEPSLLAIFEWMSDVGIDFSESIMDLVAGRGFLGVVQWLHAHSSATCTHDAMDRAAANGHLQVVQWLHANRTEGCSRSAMTAAAENGHLEVVQWLNEHRSENDAKTAMLHAASNGHLDVVVWLARVRPELVCTRCIRAYVFEGTGLSMTLCKSVDVLRWVDAQPEVVCASRCVRGARPSGVIYMASYQGDLDVVKYIYEVHRDKVHFSDPVECARRVAQAGHVGVLQWIRATFGGLPVVINDQDVEADEVQHDDWNGVIKEATENGNDQVLAWVRSIQNAAVQDT